MTTEIIVALIGLGTAALGVLTAIIGRTKTQIHRHETVGSSESSSGFGKLQMIGLVLIAAAVLGAGSWFGYSAFFSDTKEGRSLANWRDFHIARKLPGAISTQGVGLDQSKVTDNMAETVGGMQYSYQAYDYRIQPAGICASYRVRRFNTHGDAMKYHDARIAQAKYKGDIGGLAAKLVSNGGFLLEYHEPMYDIVGGPSQEERATASAEGLAAWSTVQEAFKAFP